MTGKRRSKSEGGGALRPAHHAQEEGKVPNQQRGSPNSRTRPGGGNALAARAGRRLRSLNYHVASSNPSAKRRKKKGLPFTETRDPSLYLVKDASN